MVAGPTAELCRYVRFRGTAADALRSVVLIEPPGNVPYRLLQPRPNDPEGRAGLPLARRAAGEEAVGSKAGRAPAPPEPERFRVLGEALDRGDESILDRAHAVEPPDPDQLAALWDGLAEALQDPSRHAEVIRLTNSLKAVWLSDRLQREGAGEGLVDEARSAVVHIPLLPEPPRAKAAPSPPPPRAAEPRAPSAAERRAEIDALDRFARELRAAPARLVEVPGPADLPVRQEDAPPASQLSRGTAPPPSPPTFHEIRHDLSGLSPQSRALAARFGGEEAAPAELQDRAQDEIDRLARELAAEAPAGRRLVVSGGRTSILPAGDGGTAGPSVAAREILPWPGGSPLEATKCSVRLRGVADFLRIEQTLVEYRAGHRAHVENVLQGEMKERLARSLTRSEQTIVEETERVEEMEREEQSTGHFTLENEATKALTSVAEEHRELSGSLSGGASLPGVGSLTLMVEGNLGHSSQTTKSEVAKTATKFSQSVTNRALEQIKTRVAQTRRFLRSEEFENTIRHVLDNRQGADHVVAAYWWLDQVCSARVMSEGARMVIQCDINNPGAFLRPTQAGRDIDLPEPLDSRMHPFGPLTSHKDVDRYNYAYFAGLYGVDVDPPPREGRFVSKAEAQPPPIHDGDVHVKGEIEIPAGYESIAVFGRGEVVHVPGYNYTPFMRVFVNNAELSFNSSSPGTAPLTGCVGKVAYAISSWTKTYSMTIVIECRLSQAGLEAWQIKTYRKIRDAYEQLVRDAENKAAQEQARQGVVIQGRNPVMNEVTIRTELKKAVIWALCVGEPFWLDGSAMLVCKDNHTTLPALDEATCEKLKLASLLESAIDWNLMTYQLLPYYWGDACSWQQRMGYSDPDPAYAEFLRAGAARVIVPMANGKAAALELLYFLHTGRRWTGIGPPPLLADPEGLSAYLESMALDSGPPKQVGAAWEVVVPTTLTVLECGSACVDGDRIAAKLVPAGKKAKLVAAPEPAHHTE